MQDAVSPEMEADLERLEAAIRQLKIQYDMFFAGALPRPPQELRTDVERLVKRYSNAPIRRYATRFHLNTLVARFNSLSELWAKNIRTLEEGDRPVPAVADRADGGEQILARCTVAGSESELEALRHLHVRYLDARKRAGDENVRLSFASFVRGVESQAGKLRDQAGCERVELRLVVHDRKVQIKARPGR